MTVLYPWINYHDWIIWSVPSQPKYLALNVKLCVSGCPWGCTFLRRVIVCVSKVERPSRCLWHLTSVLKFRGGKIFLSRSTAVEWCSILASRIAFKRMHPSMVLEPSLLTTGLPALGRYPPQTPPTQAYFHLTGVLLVTLSTRHFVQISISWSFSRFLSPTAV